MSQKRKASANRASALFRKYGITADDYDKMNVDQSGRCGICGRPRPLHVDHDHRTNEVRGLLCGSCNRGLGLFSDDHEALLGAVDYLQRACA